MIRRFVTQTIEIALQHQAAVALIGPRQVGKTTLAREIAGTRPGAVYLDLEARADRDKLAEPVLFLRPYENSLVVLDEICVALTSGLLDEDEVVSALESAVPGLSIALTGRGAQRRLIDMADTVTEMKCVKHGYRTGIPAQRGVEF